MGGRREDVLAHPRSVSGVALADDLFDSSDEETRFHEKQRYNKQSGGGHGERVDQGVKPLHKTVASVADSFLDFFS